MHGTIVTLEKAKKILYLAYDFPKKTYNQAIRNKKQ